MNPREIKEYFDNITGRGVLATADAQSKVNQAVFAGPHVMEDGTAAFIMPHRLTHKNLQENPHAAYLFMESGPGYKGKLLYLTKACARASAEPGHRAPGRWPAPPAP